MQITGIDWVVIVLYFALNLAIGFYYMRRASGNVSEFFLSGRSVSWWLAGTSKMCIRDRSGGGAVVCAVAAGGIMQQAARAAA